jgi:hypothetical protein
VVYMLHDSSLPFDFSDFFCFAENMCLVDGKQPIAVPIIAEDQKPVHFNRLRCHLFLRLHLQPCHRQCHLTSAHCPPRRGITRGSSFAILSGQMHNITSTWLPSQSRQSRLVTPYPRNPSHFVVITVPWSQNLQHRNSSKLWHAYSHFASSGALCP